MNLAWDCLSSVHPGHSHRPRYPPDSRPALAWRLSSLSFRQSVKTSQLSASAPLSTPPGTRPWLSLAERGPSTVTGTSSSSLSSLTSLASVSTGCKGVSSKCFGENYIYIVCQSVKYYLCQNQIQNIKKNLHSIFRRIVKTLQPETIQNIEEKLSRSALKLLWSKKAKKTK